MRISVGRYDFMSLLCEMRKMKWKLSTCHPPTFISVSLLVSSTTESFQLLNCVFRVGVMLSGADFLWGGFSPAVVVKISCEVNLDEFFLYFYLLENVLERILVFWDWHELSSPTWNSDSCVKDENRSGKFIKLVCMQSTWICITFFESKNFESGMDNLWQAKCNFYC